jgi:hypothetical protein
MTWLNDDDRLLPSFAGLWQPVSHFWSRADVWYGEVNYIDEAGGLIAAMPICRRTSDVPALLASGVAPFSQQGTIIGIDLWRRLGGINPALRIAGDFDLWVRAVAAGARFGFVPGVAAAFRVRAGQLSGGVTQARSEVEAVLRRGELKVGGVRRWKSMVRFRATNCLRILRRIRSSGRIRTQQMFAR